MEHEKNLKSAEHYSKFFVRSSVSEDEEEILSSLEEAKEGEIELLNYYRNLPVCYRAKLLGIERKIAEFAVHQYQAYIIGGDRYCFLKLPSFPENIMAVGIAQFVHLSRRMVSLRDFRYAEIHSEKRKAVRITIEPPTEIVIKCGSIKVKGRLVDISVDAAAILVSSEVNFPEGMELSIHLKLPTLEKIDDTLHELPAKVFRKIVMGEENKYVFMLHVDRAMRSQINQYIFYRQTEIIRELKDFAV